MPATLTGARPLSFPRRAMRFLLSAGRFSSSTSRTSASSATEADKRGAGRAVFGGASARTHRRIYRLAIRMEGLMIKTCQFISSRADVAPPEYVSVLRRLQDRVPTRPFRRSRRRFGRSSARSPDEIFDAFRAAADRIRIVGPGAPRSDEGRPRCRGESPVPGIDRVLETDLRNINILVKLLARIERTSIFAYS